VPVQLLAQEPDAVHRRDRDGARVRRSLALMLAERSIQAGPEAVLLTSGANHALDLIRRRRPISRLSIQEGGGRPSPTRTS
jgi:DNA-binding transcriptional MocR family regulator